MIATETVTGYVQTVLLAVLGETIMNIGGDISLYFKIFTKERR